MSLTKEEQGKLRELHTAQMTVTEISQRMQKSQAEIRAELDAMGYLPIETKQKPESDFLKGRQPVEIPQKGSTKITESIGKRICELWEQQFSAQQIAGKLGLSAPTVRKVLKEHGYDTGRRRTKQDTAAPGKTKEDNPMKPAQINKEFDAAIDQMIAETKKEPAPVAADTSSENIIPIIKDSTENRKCQAPEPLSAIKLLELIQAMIVNAYGLEATPTYIQADSALGIYRFAYEGYEYGFTFGLEMEVPDYGNDKH